MAVEVLRPNTSAEGTSPPKWTIVGGPSTYHEAVDDDSDATWIECVDEFINDVQFGFPLPSLPAGAIPTSMAIRLRCACFGSALISLTSLNATTESLFGDGTQTTVTWGTPTTVTLLGPFTVPDEELSALTAQIVWESGGIIVIHEVYADFVYSAGPIVDVTAPTGTVTATNLPTVEWDRTLDSDGGPQTHFEVKVFNDAQYLAGGFDPDTSEPFTESGEVASNATSWLLDEILPNDDYRAYVRIAQTIDGALLWSEWDFEAFTSDTQLPGEPAIALVPQPACGRMRIELDPADVEDEVTEEFQIQRSDDVGGTWADIRTVDGGGLRQRSSNPLTLVLDWEAANGATVRYRVRAIHRAAGALFSAWVESTDDSWESAAAWLKHPHLPELNMVVDIYAMPSWRRAARQSVQQPLGRSDPVVVSDARGPETGEVTFQQDTAALQAAFDELLDTGLPLLLQLPAGKHFDDAWIVFADHERARMVDKLEVEETLDTLPATKVGRPDGNVVAWPAFDCP